MNSFFQYFGFAILASAILSMVLGFIGAHLLAQKKVLQVFCFNQASLLGVLVGVLFNHVTQQQSLLTVLLFGFSLSFAVFFFTEWFFALGNRILFNARLVVFYLFLMASSFAISSYFPFLENHMAQAFFGDIVTLENSTASFMLFVSGLAAVLLIWLRRRLLRDALDFVWLGQAALWQRPSWWSGNFIYCFVIVVAIYALGMLYTTGMLFLAAVTLQGFSAIRLRGYFVAVMLTNGLATIIGFLLSYLQPKFSTAPAIVILLPIIGICCGFLLTKATKKQASNGKHSY